jgi:hypothetical protein
MFESRAARNMVIRGLCGDSLSNWMNLCECEDLNGHKQFIHVLLYLDLKYGYFSDHRCSNVLIDLQMNRGQLKPCEVIKAKNLKNDWGRIEHVGY